MALDEIFLIKERMKKTPDPVAPDIGYSIKGYVMSEEEAQRLIKNNPGCKNEDPHFIGSRQPKYKVMPLGDLNNPKNPIVFLIEERDETVIMARQEFSYFFRGYVSTQEEALEKKITGGIFKEPFPYMGRTLSKYDFEPLSRIPSEETKY